MALAWETIYSIPYLEDYEAASKREQETKPIRGDKDGTKPLGRRNQKYRAIKRTEDGSILIYYTYQSMPWFIRFCPDGELHIYDTQWDNKASGNEVIERITGMPVETKDGRAWVRYDGGTVPLAASRPHWDRQLSRWVSPSNPASPTIFVKNERGKWVCKNPPGLVTHQVNRKGAKDVRRRYAIGIAYATGLASLRRDNPPTFEETVKTFRDTRLAELKDEELRYWYNVRHHLPEVAHSEFDHGYAAQLAELLGSDDVSDQYKAYIWLAHGHGNVPRNIEKVLAMRHHAEWFKQVQHEPGVQAIERYRWALPRTDLA